MHEAKKNAFCCPHTLFVEMGVEHVHLALSQRHAQRTPEYSNSYMKKTNKVVQERLRPLYTLMGPMRASRMRVSR